jgi:hypothetical protein
MFIYLGLIEKFNLLLLNKQSCKIQLMVSSLDEHSLQSLGALPSLKNLSLQELNGTVPSGGKLTNFNSTITYH